MVANKRKPKRTKKKENSKQSADQHIFDNSTNDTCTNAFFDPEFDSRDETNTCIFTISLIPNSLIVKTML